MHFIDPRKVYVWLHTWHAKDHIAPAAIASARASDVGGRLVVERQGPADDRVTFAIEAWKRAIASGADWILRLEDDVLVNQYLLRNVCSWQVPHVEPNFGFGLLSIPSLVIVPSKFVGYGPVTGCPFREHHAMHFGGGMFVKASSLAGVIDAYEAYLRHDSGLKGMGLTNSISLTHALWDVGKRCYFHLPALVKIDLQYPSNTGVVQGEERFGTQPYEPAWRRPILPWVTYESQERIQRLVQPGMRVFEWGAGGSSAYFREAGCMLTSVEHDPGWVQLFKGFMSETWDVRLRRPTHDEGDGLYSARLPGDFRAYAQEILREPDGSVDLVFVDGRARNACVNFAIPKVRSGGWLVLDNSDRAEYAPSLAALAARGWACESLQGEGPPRNQVWRTTFARKP